jgi:ribose 1,5-bisphosphokinase PhnN
MARAILLIGSVGSGKTTTLHELEAILAARGVPNAIIDLDWLAWATPATASGSSIHDLLVRNLAAVWGTFHAAGIHHIAVARALHDAAEIEDIRRALDGCETTVVELVCRSEVLRERLRRRDSGAVLAEHLALLEVPDGSGHAVAVDALVECDAQSPEQIARDVLGAAGW